MQGKVSDLPKASTPSQQGGFVGDIYGQSYFLGYSRRQLIRNVLPFAHRSPTKDNQITLGSVLYFFFSLLMRSVLLQPCQSPKCLELISKPGAGLITNGTRSREMSNFKIQDKCVNSAKHFSTQNLISLTSIDLKHALRVKDVQKCFATQ